METEMKAKVIEHFKTGYQSSPIEVSEDEIKAFIEADCKCGYCHRSIFEVDDFPTAHHERGVICEDCKKAEFLETCPVCEEYYDVDEDRPTHFVLSKELAADLGMKAGIYVILERPYFYACTVFGFQNFYLKNIRFEADFEHHDTTEEICPTCSDRIIKENELRTTK